MATHFRGPLIHSRTGHPFDNIDLLIAQKAVLSGQMGVAIGNGNPWIGPAAAGAAGGWTLTDVGSGSSTLALNNTGQLVLTGGTTDEDSSTLQFTGIPFLYSTTRNIACFARLKCSTASTTDAIFGLFGIDTSIITTSAIAVDNGIGFFKAATATDLTGHVRITTTSTTQAMGLTIASDTFFTCGFTVLSGIIRLYAVADTGDSILTSATLLGSGLAIVNTNAPAVNLALTFGVGQEGGTTARVLTIDWAFAVQDL